MKLTTKSGPVNTMRVGMYLFAAAGVGLAYMQIPGYTDGVTQREAAAITQHAQSLYPLPLYPLNRTALDEAYIQLARGGEKALVDDTPEPGLTSLSPRGLLAQAAGAVKRGAQQELVDRVKSTEREYLIPVNAAFLSTGDKIRIASDFGQHEVGLTSQIQVVILKIGLERKLRITGLEDRDGQGIQMAITIIGGDRGKPVLLPPIQVGETLEVDIL